MTEDTNLFMEWIEDPEKAAQTLAEDTDEAERSAETEGSTEEELFELESEAEKEPTVRLVFLGEEKELPLSEAILWAQKGMNAEHALKKGADSREARLVDFLAAHSGMEREAFLTLMEENREAALQKEEEEKLKAQYPDLPEEVLLPLAARGAKERMDAIGQKMSAFGEEKAQRALSPWLEFAREFPEVEALSALPEEVLSAIDGGASPTAALQAHRIRMLCDENERLKAALDALERNERSRERTVGSARSSGAKSAADPFLLGLL